MSKTTNTNNESDDTYSIIDDFEQPHHDNDVILSKKQQMQLKCPNSNDFLFIGLTQYGVSSNKKQKLRLNNNYDDDTSCITNENDCLVTVDYLSNECNGLNSCDIQLDAQFLHTCKNLSDYLSIAYECIPGSKRIDICSNEETFIVDNLSNTRFNNFFLTSPNYPNEYASNLNNCTCKLEYVQIDNGNKVQDQQQQTTKMNIIYKAYEFDLEEGESSSNIDSTTNTIYSETCNKDKLIINSFDSSVNRIPTKSLNLCGQHKEFKEFYSNGAMIKLNFTTDDAITRRGFLIEIQPTPETICPSGTERFNSKKCIKYNENALDWSQAVQTCKSKQGGRLLTINDFVDNLKLNNIIRSKSIESIWSSHDEISFLNLKRTNKNKCISKNLTTWQEENCSTQLSFICEFDPLRLKSQTTDENRLIRVQCGSLSSVYSTTTTKATTTRKLPKRKQINKPVISWSSLIKNKSNPTKMTTLVADLFTTSRSIIIDELYPTDSDLIVKQEKLITTNKSINSTMINPINNTATITTSTGLISQELALIIAVICGFSIVFIIINIFCIWNYYNKKLRAYIETNTESNYRTSTLISRSAKLSSTSSSNNRTMSTVDSYIKMLPTYETCAITVPNYVQLTANSSPNSTACLLSNLTATTNEQKIELLKNYLQKQQQQQSIDQQHYYETLSINKNFNEYIIEIESNNTNNNSKICFNRDCMCNLKHFFSNKNNQFESAVVVMPMTASGNGTTTTTTTSSVLLNNISSSESVNNNNSQTKPLITFLNSTSSNSSTSSSPAPAEL